MRCSGSVFSSSAGPFLIQSELQPAPHAHPFAFGQNNRSSSLQVTTQQNSKLSPEAPSWRQCPNAGTLGSRGFAPFRPTLGWLSPSRNEPRSSDQGTHCSEVRLRWCPAGAFHVARAELGARMRAVNLPSTDIGQSHAPVSAFNFGA